MKPIYQEKGPPTAPLKFIWDDMNQSELVKDRKFSIFHIYHIYHIT